MQTNNLSGSGFDEYAGKWFCSDQQFNQLYPLPIQQLADRHWTPLAVVKKAAAFLAASDHAKILDIGSGAGKFCLGAAYYNPFANYFGVEQRGHLIHHANTARELLGIKNAHFFHGNFTQLDLADYDHFYFYNSFYENLSGTDKIDDSIAYSGELYNYYHRYFYKQLDRKPAGTRVASFHSLEDEMPPGYHIVGSAINNLLKFWVKI